MIRGWAAEGGGETGGSSHVPPKAVCEIVFVHVSGKGLHSPLHLLMETYDPILDGGKLRSISGILTHQVSILPSISVTL